jgi:murein tripeptide amidase MpaA
MKFGRISFTVFIFYCFIRISPLNAQSYYRTNWETRFEKSNYLETSNYDETINFFKDLADSSKHARLITLGISPQGRELKCLIAAADEKDTHLSEVKNSGKPIILIINGIHSGEIEGKDACMLLLRETLITGEKKSLIENAILMIVPIFSVDGHERSSAFNRINQNGPKEMGWRTTAQNLNLNRDFMKADAPEMRALLRLFSTVVPDFFIDTHTTDGADYQYTITYNIGLENLPPKSVEWIKNDYLPFIHTEVENAGFLISPYIGFIDNENKDKGMYSWVATPRFSNGYARIQNRPGLLIETHMLKPYKDRVFSTKALIEATLNKINEDAETLLELNNFADLEAIDKFVIQQNPYPIKFSRTEQSEIINFKGIQDEKYYSDVTGTEILRYNGMKIESQIPFFNFHVPKEFVNPPLGYIIPREWSGLLEILAVHGIEYLKIIEPRKFTVEKIKFRNVKFPKLPYEGRFLPDYKYDTFVDTVRIEEGNYFVPSNQRTIGVILHLLEPKSDDSFMHWGFFNILFERKEYFETYSFEPIAKQMLEEDIDLKREFEMRLSQDLEFKDDPRARLEFFYKRSQYYDSKHNWYPILRVVGE